MGEQLKALDQATATLTDLAIRFGPKVLVAIGFLMAGAIIGGWAARATTRSLQRFQLDPPVLALLERGMRIVVLFLFGIMALQNLGIELLPLIAGVGVAGAGVALAMQGVLGNIVAGLTIIFTRPFRVGDYISVAKEEGEVVDINLSSTILGHPDLTRVVIPNRKIVGEILHNYGKVRQVRVEVGVAYSTDMEAAFAAVRDVLAANPRVLRDIEPVIRVTRLADSSVVIIAAPWVAVPDFGAAGSEISRAILESFRRRGIAIPFPQREIRVIAGAAAIAEAGVRASA